MHGLIAKLVVDLADRAGGPEAAAAVRRRAALPDRPLRIDDEVSDDTFGAMVGAACDRLGLSAAEAEEAFAAFFLEDALRRWPTFFRMSGTSKELLARIPAIHGCLVGGAPMSRMRAEKEDKFTVEDRGPLELLTRYRSPNRLCGLYVALARKVVAHYGDEAEIDEPRCTKRGDPECELRVRWSRLGGAP